MSPKNPAVEQIFTNHNLFKVCFLQEVRYRRNAPFPFTTICQKIDALKPWIIYLGYAWIGFLVTAATSDRLYPCVFSLFISSMMNNWINGVNALLPLVLSGTITPSSSFSQKRSVCRVTLPFRCFLILIVFIDARNRVSPAGSPKHRTTVASSLFLILLTSNAKIEAYLLEKSFSSSRNRNSKLS